MKRSILFLTALLAVTITSINAQVNLNWAKGIGSGAAYDARNSVTKDLTGNTYTTGAFGGTVDFDAGGSTHNITSLGNADVFVSKLDVNGNFLWVQQFGTSGTTAIGKYITQDDDGYLYVTGTFSGIVDFNPGSGTSTLSSSGGLDIFMIKLDTAGSLIWAKSVGGTNDDYCNSIALDSERKPFFAGYYFGTVDFDPGNGVTNLTSAANSAFILSLDTSGNFINVKQFTGGNAVCNSIYIDAANNIYTTGSFQGTTDMDPGAGTLNMVSSLGSLDVYITKLNSAGNVIYTRQMGGTNHDVGNCITVDLSENVFVTGFFNGTCDFDPGMLTYNLTSNGVYDLFVCKLDMNGVFSWAQGFGNTGNDQGNALAVDFPGNVIVTGGFRGSVDFDASTSTTYSLTAAGGGSAFILKLRSDGTFLWAFKLGGITGMGLDIKTDAIGGIYTTGYYLGPGDFDPGAATVNLPTYGASDIYNAKYVDVPVGLENITYQTEVLVYPNPAKEYLKVLVNGIGKISYDLIITGITGNIITTTKSDTSEFILDTSGFSSGIYIVRVIMNNGTLKKFKLIIQ